MVSVDGKVEDRPGAVVRFGVEVSISVPDPKPMRAVPEDIPLDVVYEDADILVVNKPRGLVVHPAPGNPAGTLVNAVLFRCGDLRGINDVLRPGIVHRLDKDTTGLMVVAKNGDAYGSLSKQIKDKGVLRLYLALVHGVVRNDMVIEEPIGRHPVHRKRMAVVPSGKPATTVVRVAEKFREHSLVECELKTGRTHQVRVHMSHVGHPVVGDRTYGGKKMPGLGGQALHAWRLCFRHPSDGRPLEFSVPPPSDFRNVLERLRRSSAVDNHTLRRDLE
jgi:23S rRNA pseudouridine1911/1915/1917 synthase